MAVLKKFALPHPLTVEALARVVASFFDFINSAFRHLTLDENFRGFSAEVSIPAGEEAFIKNGFRDGSVPSGYLITSQSGGGVVGKGGTWDENFVSLVNYSGSFDVQLKVFFLR